MSADFDLKWNNVLQDTEKNLMEALLEESVKVIKKIGSDITIEIERNYPETTREESEKIN